MQINSSHSRIAMAHSTALGHTTPSDSNLKSQSGLNLPRSIPFFSMCHGRLGRTGRTDIKDKAVSSLTWAQHMASTAALVIKIAVSLVTLRCRVELPGCSPKHNTHLSTRRPATRPDFQKQGQAPRPRPFPLPPPRRRKNKHTEKKHNETRTIGLLNLSSRRPHLVFLHVASCV